MASVHELLAAAQAQKSPFISLLEGVTQGVGRGMENAPARAMQMLDIQQRQQDMERQAEMDRDIRAKTEAANRTAFNGVGGAKTAAMPAQKLKETITQDKTGRYSRQFETVDVSKPEDPTKVTVTPELAAKHPGLVVGSQVPATFLAEKQAAAKDASGKRGQDLENQFRDELNKQSGAFDTITSAYQTIDKIATSTPTPAGDLSLVFSYMKILDPGSTVREGEQAQARNATGVPEAIRNTYNRVMTGENLTPAQRADFLNQAASIYKSQEGQQRQREDQYRGLATRAGVRPEQVILHRGYLGKAKTDAAPAAGAEPAEIALPGAQGQRLAALRKKAADGTLQASNGSQK